MYIKKKQRDYLVSTPLDVIRIANSSELEFVFMVAIRQILETMEPTQYHQILGSLEKVKLEVNRKYIEPESTQNQFEEGDI